MTDPEPDDEECPVLDPPPGSPLANLLGGYLPGVCPVCLVDPRRLIDEAVHLAHATDQEPDL